MKKNNYLIDSIFLVALLFASCKKDISSPLTTATPSSFSQVFNDYWNDMNVNYVYWNIDTTNWDRVYNEYNPLFAQLNINDSNDVKQGAAYFKEIVDELIDSHYYLSITIPPVIDTIDPAIDRKKASPTYRPPYSYENIDMTNYLDAGYVSGTFTSGNEQVFALSGTINNQILYFHCDGFALLRAYQSADNGVKTTLQYFFSQLQNLPASIKGVIIDVRYNLGGDVADLNFLVGQLISQPLHFGYTRYKSGNGRLSYTPWIDADIDPQTSGATLSIPVIALADNFSASLAEMTTIAIHSLPNGTFVGETTWGATGPLTENSLYNDGQFNVGSFLSVYTSSAEFEYLNGEMYEGKGFPPDMAVPFNLAALNAGDDPILDKAISLVQ